MESGRSTEVREADTDGALRQSSVDEWIEQSVVLLCTVGSTAHGLALEGTDDRDEMGIVIEPPEYVIGLREFQQKITRSKPEGVRSEHGDLDQTLYSMRKFCSLALNGNPSILTTLFAPVVSSRPAGEVLRENAHWFASRRAGRAFLGYMTQQRQRLVGERGQMNVKRPELVEEHGYDTKYAMHMIRLGVQGIEFMETGRLTLPMPEPQRESIMRIRRGEADVNDVLTYSGELERELEDLLDESPLPDKPDYEAVNGYLVGSYQSQWRYHRGM